MIASLVTIIMYLSVVFGSSLSLKWHLIVKKNVFLRTVQCVSEGLWKHGNDQLVTVGLFILTDIKMLRMLEKKRQMFLLHMNSL